MGAAVLDETPAMVANLDRDRPETYRALFGDSADRLIAHRFDPGVLRPFFDPITGRSYMTLNAGTDREKTVTTNAPSLLTWENWKEFDDVVVRALRDRLKLIARVRGAGLVKNIPNAMRHTVLQYQLATDVGPATISMDPVRRSLGDTPTRDVGFFPLPVIHKDFDYTARQIAVSEGGGDRTALPVDTDSAEGAAFRVAELAEKLAAGTEGPFSAAGGTIYGVTNAPFRNTITNMTVPTGLNGNVTVNEILALRQMLKDDRHHGPYALFLNSQWAQFIDNDFSTTKGDNTLRQRLEAIDGIQSVEILDYLPTTQYHAVLVEMTSETVRCIVGLEPQTLQWESMAGLMKHFKVMAMVYLQFRPDTAGNSGIAHGRTA